MIRLQWLYGQKPHNNTTIYISKGVRSSQQSYRCLLMGWGCDVPGNMRNAPQYGENATGNED